MLDIVKRLRAAPETSAALHAALREVDAALPGARAALTEAEQARASLLLTGDDRSIVAAEAKIQSARIAVDRLVAASAEASRRAGEAEAREAHEALNAERAATEKRAADIAKRLLPDYERFSASLADLLRELVDADTAVLAFNQKLHQAGREDFLKTAEERAVPPDHFGLIRGVLSGATSLVPVGDAPGWGGGIKIVELGGYKF